MLNRVGSISKSYDTRSFPVIPVNSSVCFTERDVIPEQEAEIPPPTSPSSTPCSSSSSYFSDCDDFIPNAREKRLLKMISNGFIQQAEDIIRKTPDLNLSYCDEMNHINMLAVAICNDAPALVSLLLSRQPSLINETSFQENLTPLMIAIKEGHEKIVTFLLKQPEIDIYQVSLEEKNAFSYACDLKNPKIITEFLEYVDPDDLAIKDQISAYEYEKKSSEFANHVILKFQQEIKLAYPILSDLISLLFHYDKIKTNIKSILLSYRSTPKAVQSQTCKIMKFSHEKYRIVIFPSKEGPFKGVISFDLKRFELHSVQLQSACLDYDFISRDLFYGKYESFLLNMYENGFIEPVEVFLRNHDEIDLNYRDRKTGDGFICAAICKEDDSLANFLFWKNPSLINEAFYEQEMTPLMIAVKLGKDAAVGFLLRTPGIDVYKTSKNGKTALAYALESGNKTILQKLLRYSDPSDQIWKSKISHLEYQEKSKLFVDQVLFEIQKKLAQEYVIFECLVQKAFQWDVIQHDIFGILNSYYTNSCGARKKSCELIKVAADCYQMIIFGQKNQIRFSGGWKEIKPLQFFIDFDLKEFKIKSIELDVSLTHRSTMFHRLEHTQIQNLDRDGFLKYVKLPKKSFKMLRISYRKENLGINLKLFIRKAIPTPFSADEVMRMAILEAMLDVFFSKIAHREQSDQSLWEPLHDIKLDNMAIRIQSEGGENHIILSFLDTIEKMLTPGHTPISFLAEFDLDAVEKIVSHELTPFIQIVISCVELLVEGRRIYETLADEVKKQIQNVQVFLSEKKLKYSDHFVLMMNQACKHVEYSSSLKRSSKHPYGNFCLDISANALRHQIMECKAIFNPISFI